MAEALYRKYRPQVFEDVVGQEPIERTLKNALAQDKVSHAYLFCGPRGTGKTTTARLLAKALLCEHGPTPDPDGTCEDCSLIAEGVHPDVYELDAASRTGVENVREEIISRVQFAPTRGRYKVYIIDEVHMLSAAAFNALLKTLEEPPSHVVFVLCTTDPQKVPETIHSRCQRFDFRRIAPETMVSRLGAICMAEGVEFEGEALDLIAQRAEGGLRNALTSLEQIIAYESGKVTLVGAEYLLGAIDSNDLAELMGFIGRRDIASCFRWTAAYVETGADLAHFTRDMAEHVRNLYVMGLVGDDADIEVTETTRHQLAGELEWFGPDRSSRLLGVLGDLSAELKTSSNPRLSFEIALTRMVRPDSDLTLASLAERIEALESGYSAVAHVVSAPAAAAGAAVAPEAGRQGDVEKPTPSAGAQFAAPVASEAGNAPGPQHAFAPDAAGGQHVSSDARPSASAAASADENARQPHQSSQSPSAPASQLDTLANPAALQRVWQAALAAVKKEKQAHGVLFMNTKPRFDASSQTVRIVFSDDSSWMFGAAQKPEVREALAAALLKAAGFEVPFAYEQAGGSPTAQASPNPVPVSQEPAASPQPAEPPAAASFAAAGATQNESQPRHEPSPAQAPAGSATYDDEVPVDVYDGYAAPSGGYDEPPAGTTGASSAPDDIEAILQAGFGNGVVFSEVDE